MLWALEDNHAAQRAYQSLGFEPTGERQFLPGLWAVRAAAPTENSVRTQDLLSQLHLLRHQILRDSKYSAARSPSHREYFPHH